MKTIDELFEALCGMEEAARPAWLATNCADPALAARALAMARFAPKANQWFNEVGEAVGQLTPELGAGPLAGRIIGAWKLVREIGRGGMASVWLAERADGVFGQTAAIKLLQRGRESGETLRRFLAERQILSRLEHPGIARLLDGGATLDGSPYFAMEMVEGVPITTFVRERGLDVAARISLIRQICDAVEYAHRNLVVHRDLKPSNILVTADSTVKLLDFGIAKPLSRDTADVTVSSLRPMTPDYATPEQLTGDPITTLTDVYGIGALMYELLTETHYAAPLDTTWLGLERAVLEPRETPMSQSAPARFASELRGDLDTIAARALEKKPADRYLSVRDLARDLENWQLGLPVRARGRGRLYRFGKLVARHRAAFTAAAAVMILTTAFSVSLAVQSRRVAAERDRAERVAAMFVDLFNFADPEEARGGAITAREVMDRGAVQLRERFNGPPELKASLLDVTARVYQKLGLYDRAAEQLEQALSARLSAPPPDRADTQHRLGMIFNDKGDYAKAEAAFRSALSMRPGSRDAATGRSLTFLGLSLLRQGKAAEAERHFREALSIQRAITPAAPVDIAEAEQGLGLLLLGKGADREAEPLLREALEIDRRTLGAHSRGTAEAANNLAAATSRLGRTEEALKLQQEALTDLRGVYGAEHPRVATMLNNQALMLMAAGQRKPAEPLLREAIAIRRSTLAPNHPELAQSLGNLGLLLQEDGRLAEAGRLHTEALSIRQRAFGQRHVSLVQSLGSLGQLKQAQKKYGEAERYLRDAVLMSRATVGREHPLTANCIQNLAAMLAERGSAEAERQFREALAMRRRLLPPGHPHLAYTLVGLGRVLAKSGRRSEAEPLLREAVAIRAGLAATDPLRREAEKEFSLVR